MKTFTVAGIVLSEQEYLEHMDDAPLRGTNTVGWIALTDPCPTAHRYFSSGLVQPQIDVQTGTKVVLAFEVIGNTPKLVGWRIR
jgi:hypothetical protein